MRSLLFFALVGVSILSWNAAATSFGQTPGTPQTKRASCTASEYRQFDFWIGDWDTFEVDSPDKIVARNHVSSILNVARYWKFTSSATDLTGRALLSMTLRARSGIRAGLLIAVNC